MKIGERVREARLRREPRMTLAELAGSELSISLLSKIERGLVRPSLATLELIAGRLGLSAAELLGGAPMEPAAADSAVVRADALLAAGNAAAALALTAERDEPPAAAVRAAALAALGQDGEALAVAVAAERLPEAHAEVRAALALVRAGVLARRGEADAAQEAFRRALGLLETDAPDLRAAALLGLAGLAERSEATSTARSLYAQALAELGRAGSAEERAEQLRRSAERASNPAAAREAAVAARELALLARANELRVDAATRLARIEAAAGRTEQALERYREASDAAAHRSVRPPR